MRVEDVPVSIECLDVEDASVETTRVSGPPTGAPEDFISNCIGDQRLSENAEYIYVVSVGPVANRASRRMCRLDLSVVE